MRRERAMNATHYFDANLRHLQGQHHRLNQEIGEIRHALAAHDQKETLVEQLENLQKELTGHFQEEQAEDGLIDEAAIRCQSVRGDVKALMGQHAQLSESLARLIGVIKSRSVDAEGCRQMLEEFATQLKAHECAETTLLQTALGGEASEYDVEGNE